MSGAEETIVDLVSWFRLAAETLGALVIGVGLVVVIYHAVRTWFVTGHRSYTWTRIQLSHYLVLALEFQLAADILSTSIAPSWSALGKLAVIATIRTALNYFLGREIRDIEPFEADAAPKTT